LGAYVLSFVILGQLWLAHHRIFGVIARVDYAVLVRDLLVLGLIAIMPFPVRLLSDYTHRPLAVAIYAVAFITAMGLRRLIWLDVTRPQHGELLREPVPEEVRTGRCGWWWHGSATGHRGGRPGPDQILCRWRPAASWATPAPASSATIIQARDTSATTSAGPAGRTGDRAITSTPSRTPSPAGVSRDRNPTA
jgi:hypothetical protein